MASTSVIKALISYAPGVILPRIVALVMLVLLTRLMPQREYGLYALVIAMGEAVDLVCSNWVRIALERFGSGKPNSLGAEVLRCMKIYGITLAMALLLALVIAFNAVPGQFWSFLAALTAYILSAAVVRLASAIMLVRNDRRGFLLMEIGRALLVLATGLAVTQLSGTFFAVTLATSGATLAIGVWGGLRCGRDLDFAEASDVSLRNLLSFGLPLIPAAIISAALASTDRFILALLTGPATVALYSAAMVLAKQPMEFLFSVSNTRVFSHVMASYENEGPQAAPKNLAELTSGFAFLTFPAAAGIILVRDPFARLFLAPDYVDMAKVIIPFVVIATLLSGFKNFVFDMIFHMTRRSATNAWSSIPALIAGTLAMICLIPYYGIMGCVISYTAQSIILFLTVFFTTRRWIRIPVPWLDLLKTAIATSGMAGMLIAVTPLTLHLPVAIDLAVRIGAGVLTFGAFAFLLRPGPVLEYFPHRAVRPVR
ncbi:MAG: lipopolysaccharide biosynthesis protein [Rhodomicrobium sp.]